MSDHTQRKQIAVEIARAAGREARTYFEDPAALVVDQKGAQDWVSQADRNVETFVRARLAEALPDDGIVGEEHAPTPGKSGFTWVIDPIDGTTNFVNAIPTWTVVLAGVAQGQTQIGVIHDPMADETFVAMRGAGATLNGSPMSVATDTPFDSGTVGVGYSNRVGSDRIVPIVGEVIKNGAMFHRNASGALSLAYVAAGRLLGYIEEHMNAWDCLAGQLLIEEAGGLVEPQNADDMIENGGRVIAGTPDVFSRLVEIGDAVWAD